MQEVLIWAKNICFAAIGSAIMSFLLPKGNVAKTAKTILGLFLIWIMFIPFARFAENGKINDVTWTEYENEQTEISSAAITYAEKQAEYSVAKILNENHVEYREISVFCNIEPDGVININRIEIITGGNVHTVTDLIESTIGLSPVIISE